MTRNLLLLCTLLPACGTLATSPDWVGGSMSVTGPGQLATEEENYESERKRRASEPDEIAARHVLVMHDGSKAKPPALKRSRKEARARAQACLVELRGGAEFAAMVRKYTDEPGGAGRGGDLSTFRRDTMVKRFSDAAFALKVGQISEVIETAYGFHVIQRSR
ncbi:MAG: peptidylprolyl isomerase [Polyangiaceae bacterium]